MSFFLSADTSTGNDHMSELYLDSDKFTAFQPPAIALIDDDPLFGALFKEYASSKGFYAQYYTSLAEVPNLDSFKHYQVVVIDMDLGPGPSGLNVAKTIREALPDVPLVLVSGDTMVGFENQPDCVDAFITKRIGLEGMLQIATDVYKRMMQ